MATRGAAALSMDFDEVQTWSPESPALYRLKIAILGGETVEQAEALVEAHRGPWAGVGGEIYNGCSARGFADPIYLMGHGPWIPPAPRGEAELTALHDTCYKREILLQYGDELGDLMLAETVLMRRLRLDGHRLYVDPEVKSMHGYTVTPLTLVAFYAWSRCFAASRARAFKWSPARRLMFGLLSPLIPPVRAARLLFYLVRRRPASLPTFFVGLPVILLAQAGAAVGEGLGMLFGLGDAERLYTQSHLRGLRLRPEYP